MLNYENINRLARQRSLLESFNRKVKGGVVAEHNSRRLLFFGRTYIMPKIGEIRRAEEVGYKGWAKFIWHACVDCGAKRWVQYNHFKTGRRKRCKTCGNRIRGINQSGTNCPNWKGGRHITVQGYVMLRLSEGEPFYEMVGQNGYVREHRLVMAKYLGRTLKRREFVHHKNGIKTDNAIDNLELVTPKGHMGYHVSGYRDGYKKGFKDGRLKQIVLLKSKIKELEGKLESFIR